MRPIRLLEAQRAHGGQAHLRVKTQLAARLSERMAAFPFLLRRRRRRRRWIPERRRRRKVRQAGNADSSTNPPVLSLSLSRPVFDECRAVQIPIDPVLLLDLAASHCKLSSISRSSQRLILHGNWGAKAPFKFQPVALINIHIASCGHWILRCLDPEISVHIYLLFTGPLT